MAAIVHADVDAFFIQVEQQAHPHLQNRAVALQQHGDIIAANEAAKVAGVKKHCAPDKARALLRSVNGVVAYVNVGEGGMISYKPYRDVSAKFFAMLGSLELASVVEKGSIDEAYILCSTSGPSVATGSNTSMQDGGVVTPAAFLDPHALQVATSLADTIRQRAWSGLGLRVSVGVAHNKLLAKLASAAAKPDGVHAVVGEASAADLLRQAPVSRLPGFGGKVAKVFAAHSIHSAEQVRLPPKALTLQISLTPTPTTLPPAARGKELPRGVENDGVLQPLYMHASDAPARIRSLVGRMLGDLLGRVWHDGEVQGRWPTALTLKLRTYGPGGQFLSRSNRFPPYADLSPWASTAAVSLPPSTPPTTDDEEGAPSTSGLIANLQPTAEGPLGTNVESRTAEGGILDDTVRTAMAMFQDMRRAHVADLPVVEMHVGATKFKSRESAKMKPLTSFVEFGRSLAHVKIDEDATRRTAAAGSDSPRGIKRKPEHVATVCFDGADSPRLWPMADTAADASKREQQGEASKDAAGSDGTGAPGVERLDLSCADTAEQGCVGFGSPIAGLIRQDSASGPSSSQEEAPRRSPRHSDKQSVAVRGFGSGGVEVGCTVGDGAAVCAPARADNVTYTAWNHSQGHAMGDSGVDHSRTLPHAYGACRDGDAVTNLYTRFDPSAQQSEHPGSKAQAPSGNVTPGDSTTCTQNAAKVVDFAELMCAWHRNEVVLDAGDASTVANAIMRGLKR